MLSNRDPRVDRLMDHYIGWREECVAVQAAYERWGHAPNADRTLAFGAYSAALDREQLAAECYRSLVGELTDVAPRGLAA